MKNVPNYSQVKVVALTGCPGVGKSTVAEILKKRGYTVKKVDELARKYNCIIDQVNDTKIINIEKLKSKINNEKSCNSKFIIIEGHLSHLLNPDIIIILRCNPLILKKRLKNKGWPNEKILENVEAELIDYILIEALDQDKEIYEIDTSNIPPNEVANIVERILSGKDKNLYRPGKIDWIKALNDKIDEIIRK